MGENSSPFEISAGGGCMTSAVAETTYSDLLQTRLMGVYKMPGTASCTLREQISTTLIDSDLHKSLPQANFH